jgi:hypothetical protein
MTGRHRIYAGIGSRRAPGDVLELIERLARRLRQRGWTCRTGHAPGCDQAFERGAGRQAEVYLPWPTFERSVPLQAGTIIERPEPEAFDLAAALHPAWPRLGRGVRALVARNGHQVLGRDLRTPVSAVVCWTPDAATALREISPATGGTGQALRIACRHGIPILNLARPDHRKRAAEALEDLARA